MTPEVYIDFINKFDVDKVALTNDEILNSNLYLRKSVL